MTATLSRYSSRLPNGCGGRSAGRSAALVEVWLKRPPRNHVWLRLSDGRALNPSADRFNAGLPPVYLGPPLAGVHEL